MEAELRKAARGMNQTAEKLKMVRLAQTGGLANYLIAKEVRKAQNKMNRQLRKQIGLKF